MRGTICPALKTYLGTEVVAVAESDQRRVSAHAGLLEGLTVVSDYDQLLRPGPVDGV
jgi:hypothetical protein